MPDNPLDLLLMLPGDSAFLRHNYLAYASGAMLTLDVAGNANVTLTEAEAAHYQITLTGVLTGNILLLVPQKEQPYIFSNATTGAFSITVQPVTSGVGRLLTRGMFVPLTCNGINVVRMGPGMARIPAGLFHTIAGDEVRNEHYHDTYMAASTGTHFAGRHARGTQETPAVLLDEDRGVSLSGYGWGRDAANTLNEWISLGIIRIGVDSVDAEGRLGGYIEFVTSPSVSATGVGYMRLNQEGTLILGKSATSVNKISLVTGDRDGVAGKHSLTVITEDGTEHTFGDRLRMTRLANGQSVDVCVVTEVTTIAAAAFTDTTFEIPADAVVESVSARVQSTIPTATTFVYGVAGATTRYSTSTGISTAATTRYAGATDLARHYPTATKIRITPNLTPAAATGAVRVTCHYKLFIAPDS